MAESFKFGHWGVTSEEILGKQFPLHRACRDGDVEALSMLLIEAQCGIYTEDSFYGWTPAHWAAYFGKLACVRKLLSVTRVGVDCNIKTSRFSQTPAHLAAFGGHPQCLQWLLDSASEVDAQDYLGETPLHKAARTGSMECTGLLVSHGARLVISNNNGLTPSQLASDCKNVECGRFLEAATTRQENSTNHITGHINNGHTSSLHITTEPSPDDVTCVRNGGKIPPSSTVNGFSPVNGHAANGFHGNGYVGNGFHVNGHVGNGDCDMMEDMDCEQRVNGHVTNGHVTNGEVVSSDVTLHAGVSRNCVAVAGKKRSREDDDGDNCKRARTNVASHNQWEGVDMFNSATIACDHDDQHHDEDDVGFDYNGLPCNIGAGDWHGNNNVSQAPSKCVGLSGHFI